MSIQSEINKLRSNLANSYEAASLKGATLPLAQNFDNLASAISTISSGGGDNSNAYNYELIRELEYEITEGALTKAGISALSILQTGETLNPLEGSWKYKPVDLSEKFNNILNSKNEYVQQKFTEILGEINE